MRNHCAGILFVCFILPSCSQHGKYNPAGNTQSDNTLTADSLKSVQAVKNMLKARIGESMQLFCNNEINSYCVLLPLQEFKEDYNNLSLVKVKHKFVLKNDTSAFNSIEVQAFTIDKKNNYNTKLFYQRDKSNIEKGGLSIDTSYIDEAKHLYLIKGYLPNYMNMRFVQLNWILGKRIALYFNYYDKDEALWMDWIKAIIQRGVSYSNY